MIKILAALCVILLIPAPSGDEPDDDFLTDPDRWISLAPPEKGSNARAVAEDDFKHEWVVTLRDGRPEVHLFDDRATRVPDPLPFEIEKGTALQGLSGRRHSVKVSDGWLVAFNAGEFGAGLWWFSPDGKKREKLSETWINQFVETKSGLLALEGLAHGLENRGRVLRLARNQEGRWHSETFVELQQTAWVAAKEADDSLIVPTTGRLLRVKPAEKKIEVMIDDAFWENLYPSSMVITPAGTIYLGMRHGVAKIEKAGKELKIRWLLPNQEFVNMKVIEGLK